MRNRPIREPSINDVSNEGGTIDKKTYERTDRVYLCKWWSTILESVADVVYGWFLESTRLIWGLKDQPNGQARSARSFNLHMVPFASITSAECRRRWSSQTIIFKIRPILALNLLNVSDTEHCGYENNIDYQGNDDTLPNGKLQCSSGYPGCTESSPVPDVPSCKLFCSSSDYFTWKSANKECYCKNSDRGRKQQVGSVSGRTNCQGKTCMIRWPQADNNYKLFLNAECVTESGAKSNQECIFPFIFNGVVYNGCTLDNAGDNKAWCSVGTDADGVHINSDWGHCPSSCKMHDGA